MDKAYQTIEASRGKEDIFNATRDQLRLTIVDKYSIHPTPYTLNPTHYTLHTTHCTLHTTHCTLHHTPYTPHLYDILYGP